MPEYIIGGIPVQFPFEPYDVQRAYMERVIECLKTGQNGMLESPTGTGKTLSLLCSTLGWLTVKKAQLQAARMQAQDGNDYLDGLKNVLTDATGTGPANQPQSWAASTPKIIYSSRTHSQLTQAIAELKRTSYTNMRVAVLGSRDQLCSHPDVSKEETAVKMSMCQTLVKARSCHLHRNIERKKDDKAFEEAGVMDIEDLIKVSTKLHVCPYYMSRELKQLADIVFMPYNYLLDPRTRKQQDVDLNNSIVILDEGHNVEKMCEESASYQICSTDIAICISEVTSVMKAFAEMPSMNDFNIDNDGSSKDFTTEDLIMMKTVLLELEKAVDGIQLTEKDKTERSLPGEFIFELLAKASITPGQKEPLLSMIEKIVQYLSTTGNTAFQRTGAGLDKLATFIRIVYNMERRSFQDHFDSVRACYKVFVTLEKPKNLFKKRADTWLKNVESDSKPGGKMVNFWCFHPGFGMRNLAEQGVHSIIVTSGTLSPLPPLIAELGIDIQVTLENGHVIDKEQVYVSVVRQGPDGVQLNSAFRNRDDPAYMSSLGRTILNFARIIPEGLLVFFPSYPVLNKCKDHWQQQGIWSQICAIKEIFVEPQGKRDLKDVMTSYYSRIVQPGSKGACFLAVCRGKVSEGLDFADHNGRAVILTGLPYPPFFDPRVLMKKDYLDKNKKKVTGANWYQLEATRAVNQAVGRVIRHRHDYGAILFCDSRFGDPGLRHQMSAWLRPYVQNPSQFGLVTRGICQFFKFAKEKLPQPKGKVMSEAWAESTDEMSTSKAVSASFDTSARWLSSKSVTATPGHGNFNWNTPTSSTPKTPAPSYSQSPVSQTCKPKPTSMFGALEESVEVIDFNHVDSSQALQDCTNHKDEASEAAIRPPDAKKRKLKVMGVSLAYDSPSEGSAASASTSQSQTCEGGQSKAQRMVSYLKQVKGSLSKEDMAKFNNAVRSYSSASNFSALMGTLDELFYRPGLYSCIRGFESYIKGAHKAEFASYCAKRLKNH